MCYFLLPRVPHEQQPHIYSLKSTADVVPMGVAAVGDRIPLRSHHTEKRKNTLEAHLYKNTASINFSSVFRQYPVFPPLLPRQQKMKNEVSSKAFLLPVKVPKSHTWVKVKIPYWKRTLVKVKVAYQNVTWEDVLK